MDDDNNVFPVFNAARYAYLAQRAAVECEVDAAALFKRLAASAHEQALGHLELLEEYGDASFASTMDNVDGMAEHESNEADAVEILSGVQDDVTLGTPIAMLVRNKDQRSQN